MYLYLSWSIKIEIKLKTIQSKYMRCTSTQYFIHLSSLEESSFLCCIFIILTTSLKNCSIFKSDNRRFESWSDWHLFVPKSFVRLQKYKIKTLHFYQLLIKNTVSSFSEKSLLFINLFNRNLIVLSGEKNLKSFISSYMIFSCSKRINYIWKFYFKFCC